MSTAGLRGQHDIMYMHPSQQYPDAIFSAYARDHDPLTGNTVLNEEQAWTAFCCQRLCSKADLYAEEATPQGRLISM